MTPLLVATRNRGKQAEFRTLLAPLGRALLFPEDIGLAASSAEDELEVFDTFEANARAKAQWFFRASGLATVADDSGVEVDALAGAPGVRSRRFSGIDGPDHEVAGANNAALLARLAGMPSTGRTARYRGVLYYIEPTADGGVRELAVGGMTEGRILVEPRGAGGFGYDPLFWSTELEASFGEVSQAVKGSVSHRARAAGALIAALQQHP